MSSQAYTRKGERAEVTISKTKKTWLVSHVVRIQGETTGWKVSIPYGGDFPRKLNLDLRWNDCMDNFTALVDRADTCRTDPDARRYYHAHIVSRGYKVE